MSSKGRPSMIRPVTVGLLTWPTYGTWLPGPARGWIDPGQTWTAGQPLPEPDAAVTEQRRRGGLKWPPVLLDTSCQRAMLADLPRIAALRRFALRAAVAAPDHVHLLLEFEEGIDLLRLIQLIKGALSRALSVACGDQPAVSTGGAPLRHQKWWGGQYSFLIVRGEGATEQLTRRLEEHGVMQTPLG